MKPVDRAEKRPKLEKHPDREGQAHPAKEGMRKDEVKERDLPKQANEEMQEDRPQPKREPEPVAGEP
jgi:hypothetical protein